MLEDLLPLHVAIAWDTGDDSIAGLYPAEAAIIGDAVASRRLEFTTARNCARQALVRLGVEPVSILRGPKGEPKWPTGVVGSITHCQGFRGAAVALESRVRAIGIDAEPHTSLPQEVRDLVLRPEEKRRAASNSGEVRWDLLVFVAKECVYKAWFPIAGTWLDHAHASVSWDPRKCTFRAELLGQTELARKVGLEVLHGRFTVRNGLLLAAIIVPP